MEALAEKSFCLCVFGKVKQDSNYIHLQKNVAEAKGEAELFLNCIKGKTFEYPIYFDIEDKSLQNLSKQLFTDIVLTWCGKVQSAGYYVGIYANPDWFTNRLDLEKLKGFDKWLATG